MRKYINKIANGLISNLERIRILAEKNRENSDSYFFEDLTPINTIKNDSYIEGLKWALRNERIKNIALTGPYGSGKTSILETFKKIHKEFNYLNISLASFNQESSNSEELNRLIEQSILQQIFYGVNSKTIPDSRFKRIQNLKFKNLLVRSLLTFLWIFASLFLFKPVIFSSIILFKNLDLSKNIALNYFLLIVFSLGLITIVFQAIRILRNSKFNKFNFRSGEIELNESTEASILNKHFDEILYFFEVTRYNVVIIEDLERFNKLDIFTKLREINFLLNNSKQVNRRIVFIYAVKDDMFTSSKDRTKFFDFIIPVIPIINSSNSGEILIKKLQDSNLINILQKDFLNDISLYIDDMRILKNIYNEFIIYKCKLGNVDLDPEKLFSIIIYKNLYPNDFARLHKNEGMIYNVFANKKILSQKLTDQIDNRISNLKTSVEALKNEFLLKQAQLRYIYIGKLVQLLPANSVGISLENTKYHFNQLEDPQIFELLTKQPDISYQPDGVSGRVRNSGISFKTIQEQINPESNYTNWLSIIEMKENNKAEGFKEEIEKLNYEKGIIESMAFKELLEMSNISFAFEETIRKESILIYLIRNGYINEYYHSYISHFYPGSLTKEDMDFVLSVKNQIALEFGYKLSNINEVIKKLQLIEFSKEMTLNYDLIDYILDKKEIYKNELEAIINQLINKTSKSIYFIESYIKVTQHKKYFINILCKRWVKIWSYLESESDYSTVKKDEYLMLILQYCDIELIVKINNSTNQLLGNYISKKDTFLELFSDNENIVNIKELLKVLGVKFNHLAYPKIKNELFDFIFENNLYEINQYMISLILEYKFGNESPLIENLKTSNFTTIQDSGCTELIGYIEKNINDYVSNVFLAVETNMLEAESTIINLLNNESISIDNKNKIIEKVSTVLRDMATIDPELWSNLINHSKIVPTWQNISTYYEYNEAFDDTMIRFLNLDKNYEKLANQMINEGNEVNDQTTDKISKELLLCQNLSDISFQYLSKSIPYMYDALEFENLSNTKVKIMVTTDLLSLTADNYNLLKAHFPRLHITLIEKNIKSYLAQKVNYKTDSEDIRLMLESKSINRQYKILIIRGINIEETPINKDLANIIIIVLLGSKPVNIELNLLTPLIEFGTSIKDRIELLCTQIDFYRIGVFKTIIGFLPYPYYRIAKNGKRPKLENEKFNMLFVEKLMEKGYISSFKLEKNKIRINTHWI